jgi:hypothetical protein
MKSAEFNVKLLHTLDRVAYMGNGRRNQTKVVLMISDDAYSRGCQKCISKSPRLATMTNRGACDTTATFIFLSLLQPQFQNRFSSKAAAESIAER